MGVHSMSLRPPTLTNAKVAQRAMTGTAITTAPAYRPRMRTAAAIPAIVSWSPESPRSTPRRLSRENLTGVSCESLAVLEVLVVMVDQFLEGEPDSAESATCGGAAGGD